MKTVFRNIHLYLSLVAGIIIMITCLTGAILVFEKELQQAFNHDRYFVEKGNQRLGLAELQEAVKAAVPGAKPGAIKIYAAADRSVEISYSVKETNSDKKDDPKPKEDKPKGEKGKGKEAPQEGARKTAFVDPYTGKVLELYSYRETFFYKVFALH